MSAEFGKVAVLMGGNSAERDVSLKSGRAVLEALLNCGVDAIGIDTAHNLFGQLLADTYDYAFIILHGRGGEDGCIQGVLEHLGIPYTGSGVLGSALAMDKYRTKQVWQGMGLPTPSSIVLNEHTDFEAVATQLGFPLMVKPVLEGSSVGISKVNNQAELRQAWETAAQCDSLVIAEKFVHGAEYTIAVLEGKALPVIRVETPRDFYDFEAKYQDDHTLYHCPCGLDTEQEQRLQTLAEQAIQAVGVTGWGRVDVMYDAEQKPWLLEVNTVPGMTDHSLVPMAAKAAGLDFDALVLRILKTSSLS